MNGFAKKIKYILPLCALLVTAILCLLIFSAYGAPESVSVLNNGSRLVAIPVGDDSPSYQWQISDSANGTFRDIDGATQKFYDITSNDKNGYIRVSACGTVSEPVGPIKNIITFDLSLAAVTIGSSISGKAPDGTSITGAHSADNVYVIMQSDNANYTKNGISFTGNYPNTPFDVTLQELNMGVPAVKFDQSPGASGSSYPSGGSIEIPATIGNAKNVILRLKGENIVRNITYYNAGDTSVKQSGILSSLKITDINGDGATDGGSLYMPVKVAPEEIDAFVAKNTNYNHWYAAIGGTDGQSYVENLTIAGGKLQVLTTLGDNCTAIGAGGNGYGQVTITGGEIVAHCNGTGAAIGGGIGWQEAGGIGYVTITGGKVYAKNHANIVSGGQTVGGVAIGGGSSFQKPGTGGEVVIEGGYVEAYGTFGNGIGGGNSSAAAGGTETVKISGGTVISNSIGGGNSKVGTGGSATVIVSGDANVTIIKGIGGGLSQSGSGGSATVTVNSGTLNCSGTIGGGQASGTEGTGGAATITVNGGTLNCTGTIGGGVGSGTGVGGNANITVTNGTLSAGGIGGGTGGDSGNGGDATVTVTNGTLNCTGTIGGGTGNGVGNGGDATLIVENGTLNADSLGGGTGGSLGDGGAADVTINGGTIRTGSIGGGNTLNTNGNLGYAKAMISGGDIQGQFIMAAGGTEPCSFTMTGGTLSNVNTADTSIYNYAKANGGAVYMDDPNGVVTLSGGTILNCSAQNGGAVYMTAGRFTISGEGSISSCNSTEDGGGVYLGGGELTVNGGSLTGNNATLNGGGVYLGGGELTINGGSLTGNTASQNGGAAYVNGGNVYVNGGSLTGNTASQNGGGVAINNGNYYMKGGAVDNNTASSGSGGGIYIAAQTQTVTAEICTGSVSNNTAGVNGGAVAVVGAGSTQTIIVTVGVNDVHEGANNSCDHNGDGEKEDNNCPVIVNNRAGKNGGAMYVSGGTETQLNTYCLIESGSKVGSDSEQSRSDFMKVEGGKVVISTNDKGASSESDKGNIHITTSTYVTGGQVDIYGSMQNPHFDSPITVDITKDGDHFNDHRINSPSIDQSLYQYKLIYYENFTNPNGTVTGQYTEYIIDHGNSVTISGSIYSHDGYEILGWYTQANGGGIKYEVGKDYLFTNDGTDEHPGDLTIYAIWKSHYYDVYFESGIPSDVQYGGSEMEKVTFVYDTPKNLPLNTYIYPGYNFDHWYNKYEPEKTYTDGQEVINLSSIDGAVITLVGYWVKCTHTNGVDATYSYVENGNVLTVNCSCGGYTNDITMSANNAVYDGNPHGATYSYVENSITGVYPSVDWNLPITYTGDNLGAYDVPVNAGTYDASVSYGGHTALIEYVIDKATQNAPKDKPTFITETGDGGLNNIININEYSGEKDYDWQTIEYRIAYYSGSQMVYADWSPVKRQYTLDVSLTNYFVQIRFAEKENYYPSDYTQADSVYYFAGDITLTPVPEEGIIMLVTEYQKGDDLNVNGLTVTCIIKDGYYMISDSLTAVMDVEVGGGGVDTTEGNFVETLVYKITKIPQRAAITLAISGVAKSVSVRAKVEVGDRFAQISGGEATVTRDSSFTALFEINNYQASKYSDLSIAFSTAIPQNTAIILYDLIGGTYWHYTASSSKSAITLNSFTKMGSSGNFEATADTLLLQFVIDFCYTQSGCAGDNLSVYLSAVSADAYVPKINQEAASVSVILANVPDFGLQIVQNDSLTSLQKQLTVTFANIVSDAVSTKWQKREGSLVITPTTDNLPKDAQIVLNGNGYHISALREVNGCFILPISGLGVQSVTLTLTSSMFPQSQTNYSFTVDLMASCSKEGEAPLNGQKMASINLVLTSIATTYPALKITEYTNNNGVYRASDFLAVTIAWDNMENRSATANLLFKNENGGYANTALNPINITDEGVIRISLAGQTAGSFCLMVTVKDESGANVLSVPFYFIIV